MRKHKKHKSSRQTPTLSSCSPHVVLSVTIFSVSVIVFVHQCIHPLSGSHGGLLQRIHRSSWYQPLHRNLRHDLRSTQPRNWFANIASAQDTNATSADSDANSISGSNKTLQLKPVEVIPEGPVPLPDLHNATGNTTWVDTTVAKSASGSSWTGSLAQGVLNALPLHWVAEVIHSAPRKEDVPPHHLSDRQSIFSARRKGVWMGCSRPFHLVCKGVYRAIKHVNAVNVVDLSCERNIEWLPHILHKLKSEFRLVHLTCAVKSQGLVEKVKREYDGVERLKVEVFDPFKDTFANNTDMVIAYRFLAQVTLIEAMRFFKNVKESNTVSLLAMENYPDARNRHAQLSEDSPSGKSTEMRLNLALAPFNFPPPVYEYENVDENPEFVSMSICTYKVEDMFQRKTTPEMKDLVDPRKRHVRE